MSLPSDEGVEVVDVEDSAKAGRPVPQGRRYRIRINEQRYVVDQPVIRREQVLELGGFEASDELCVRVRIRGEKPHLLQPGEEVDLTHRGVERFQVHERCAVEIKVNGVEFRIAVPTTGLKIKQAAIEAGAKLELDFLLFLELEDGQTDQVGDDEVIFVDKGASFTAVPDDDAS